MRFVVFVLLAVCLSVGLVAGQEEEYHHHQHHEEQEHEEPEAEEEYEHEDEEHAVADDHAAEFAADLEACRGNVHVLEQERQTAWDQVTSLRESQAVIQQDLANTQQVSGELSQTLERVQAELQAAQEQWRQATQALAESQATIASTEEERKRLKEQLESVKSDVEKLETEKDDERNQLKEQLESVKSDVEKLEKEKKNLRELMDEKVEQLKKDYERKLERMWGKERTKQEELLEKLRVSQERFAKTKETLFETRRELHAANKELRFQRRITSVWAAAKDRVQTFVEEDKYGVIAAYKEKVQPVVHRFLALAVPAVIFAKDVSVLVARQVARHLVFHWETHAKPFLTMVWKQHIKPNAILAWDATSEYRAIADEKLQMLTSQIISHPIWQKYPQIARGQQWLTEKTCTGTDVISSFLKMQSNGTEGLPVFIVDSGDFVHTHCEKNRCVRGRPACDISYDVPNVLAAFVCGFLQVTI